MSSGEYDITVFLGDIADDWDQEYNISLYAETYDKVIRYIEKYPNSLFCYGNHDLSYQWMKSESGFSDMAVYTVGDCLRALEKVFPDPSQVGYVHCLDQVIFSHAGVTKSFADEWISEEAYLHVERWVPEVNSYYIKEIWTYDSPIWSRAVMYPETMHQEEYFQVVGHTPIHKAMMMKDHPVLCTDTFSTYSTGVPIGEQKFIWVDTNKKTWGYCGSSAEEIPLRGNKPEI